MDWVAPPPWNTHLIINFGSLYNFISIKVLLTDGIIDYSVDYDFISLAVVTFFRYISVPLYVFSLLETCIEIIS